MSRFAETLKQTSTRLALPQPARARVLLEIAGDMEDLYQAYLEKGLPEEEAQRRAIERLDLSDEALVELGRVHGGFFRRLLAGLSDESRRNRERGALAIVLLLVCLFAMRLLPGGRIFQVAGPFVWPVLVGAFGTLALALVKVYQVLLRKEHKVLSLRRDLGALLFLSGGLVWLGVNSLWLDLYRTALRLQTTQGDAARQIVDWLYSSAAILEISLISGILFALLWFILYQRVTTIEQAEAAMLMEI